MTGARTGTAPASPPSETAAAAPTNDGDHCPLLLLGAGHAHLAVLERLARLRQPRRPAVTLVSPSRSVLYSGMLPGLLAGHYHEPDCTIALDTLLARSGVTFIEGRAVRLDAARRQVEIVPNGGATDGQQNDPGDAAAEPPRLLGYDLLSIDTGAVMERDRMEQLIPGTRLHALFVRPLEQFAQLWPQLCAIASARRLRMAVIGAGAGGVELALAIRHRLPTCELTLLTGGNGVLANYPDKVQRRAARALRRGGVTVLDTRCTTISPEALLLDDGKVHECDAVLIATGAQPPGWLAGSGLALDDDGFITIDAQLRSRSHPEVFAAGDVATRPDAPQPRSGVQAVRQAPVLCDNLLAMLSNDGLKRHDPPARTLSLLSCGNQYAIASWGDVSFEGRWVWRWKDRIDRGYVARFARA